MARKRAPENDYICIRCGGAVDGPWAGAKHVSGGAVRGQRACGKDPVVRLRSEWEAQQEAEAQSIAVMLRERRGRL